MESKKLFKPRKYFFNNLKRLVLEKKTELGRIPTVEELNLKIYAFDRYGGYNLFLKVIGEKPKRIVK